MRMTNWEFGGLPALVVTPLACNSRASKVLEPVTFRSALAHIGWHQGRAERYRFSCARTDLRNANTHRSQPRAIWPAKSSVLNPRGAIVWIRVFSGSADLRMTEPRPFLPNHYSRIRSICAGRAASGRQAKANPDKSVAPAPPATIVSAETASNW